MTEIALMVMLVAAVIALAAWVINGLVGPEMCPRGGVHQWQATQHFRERRCDRCGKRQFLMREWEDC
jgi:hypothetical protein